MNEKILAAKLFNLNKEKQDQVLLTIKVAQLMKGANIDLVLKAYQDILDKKITIVEVNSAIALSSTQKDLIKTTMTKKFDSKELVYLFNVNNEIKGIEIKLNDDVVDFSSVSKYF